jgi:hypothetical protein
MSAPDSSDAALREERASGATRDVWVPTLALRWLRVGEESVLQQRWVCGVEAEWRDVLTEVVD